MDGPGPTHAVRLKGGGVKEFDAIVIGTGQAGKPLAKGLAAEGLRTAIIEKGRVGGTCVIDGCTPTKTMVASARVAHMVGRAADFGVDTGMTSVDLETVRERKRSIVDSFSSGAQDALEEAEGVELIFGTARFTADHELEVVAEDGSRSALTAPRIFINTGTRTRVPPVKELSAVPWLDNASIMELAEVPDHLLVLGGGFIGLEFGHMFRRFGAQVTIIEGDDQLVGREDADVADSLRDILEGEGVTVRLESRAVSASHDTQGVVLRVEGPDGDEELRGSHLLVAVGRRPNTDDLGLDNTGLQLDDNGFVEVDDALRTSVEGVWALGDVNGGPPFTHVAYDDYRIVQENVLGSGGAHRTDRVLSYTLFTDPQLGRVGLTESQAREEGFDVRVGCIPTARVARAKETDETRGLMKVVVDAEADRILGAAILAPEGGEIAAMIQVAMMGGLAPAALRDGLFSHPTWSEGLNTLFGSIPD